MLVYVYPGKELLAIENALHQENLKFRIIDLLSDSWSDIPSIPKPSFILVRPPDTSSQHKEIIANRVKLLGDKFGIPAFPSFDEINLYEDKIRVYDFLKLGNFPMANTRLITSMDQLLALREAVEFPMVFKGKIGSSGLTVKLVRDWQRLFALGMAAFGSVEKAPQSERLVLSSKRRVLDHDALFVGEQRDFVLLQEFVDHLHEWRMIRVGTSYFGHKKLKDQNGFASGSGLVGWDIPPRYLLRLLDEVTTTPLNSCIGAAVDILETKTGEFLINEIQPIFGAYDTAQMYKDGTPCRFVKNSRGEFDLEYGSFFANSGWTLRLKEILSSKKFSTN